MLGIARRRRAGIFPLIVEAGVELQELAELLELALRHFLVERLLVDRLGEQLADPPVEVVAHPPLGIDLAAEIPAGGAVDVDEHLHRHVEAPGIVEDQPMRGRDSRSAGVEVKPLVISRPLIGPTGLDDPIAAAHGPHPATDTVARLEHGDLVARLAQLIGGDQAGDPGAEYDHRLAGAAALAAARNPRLRAGVE